MTDIDIAEQTKIKNIKDVAAELDLTEEDLYCYGTEKAKVKKNWKGKR